ncbi:MAG TPA: aminotransferase class V-fold PLP-dependent enzyme [Anaerolineales bacterium]|nr:aminotransferase class V-fold PLP-dependent enzyme [Anaerolineales bacterium]
MTDFLLNSEITFLNHGSFGACPKPVLQALWNWQVRMEHQPVAFLGREIFQHLEQARQALADYINAPADDLVYYPNPTTAMAMVANSLQLRAGDEVLTTDHEYGAMERLWLSKCQQWGARYVRQTVPLPLENAADFVETFWQAVTPRTRIIFLSHITSPTALIFPVQEICRRARQHGILCIVDGAHVPGHIPLDIQALDPDIYTAALHKWLMAPKGSSFLYVRKDLQAQMHPLIVSWGSTVGEFPRMLYKHSTTFIDEQEWQGTRDHSAFLATPAAIAYQRQHNWVQVQRDCHALASSVRQQLLAICGQPALCADSPEWYGQMFSVALPAHTPTNLKEILYEQYRIEVPVFPWQDKRYMRVSFQVYNTAEDGEKLLTAMREILCAT